jgi:hypothetical protein
MTGAYIKKGSEAITSLPRTQNLERDSVELLPGLTVNMIPRFVTAARHAVKVPTVVGISTLTADLRSRCCIGFAGVVRNCETDTDILLDRNRRGGGGVPLSSGGVPLSHATHLSVIKEQVVALCNNVTASTATRSLYHKWMQKSKLTFDGELK